MSHRCWRPSALEQAWRLMLAAVWLGCASGGGPDEGGSRFDPAPVRPPAAGAPNPPGGAPPDPPATIPPPATSPLIPELIGRINLEEVQRLAQTLQDLSQPNRATGTDTYRRATEWIRTLVTEEAPALEVRFDERGELRNVEIKIPGTDPGAGVYIVGGHFDSVTRTPGMDDNGSGSLGTALVARALGHYTFQSEIRLVLFDAEEVGLLGSTYYARNLLAGGCAPGSCLKFYLNLDMIGHDPDRRQLVQILTASRPIFDLLSQTGRAYEIGLAVNRSGTSDCNASDDCSFSREGYATGYVFEARYYPLRHTPSDTVEVINFDTMTRILKLVAASVATAAGIQDQPAIAGDNQDAGRTVSAKNRRRIFIGAAALVSLASAAKAQPRTDPAGRGGSSPGGLAGDGDRWKDLRWRLIGPHRGGRTKAAAGVPGQPNRFYLGVCNGGVWESTDSGRSWSPIFDDQPSGSIGALAIAPSDPRIIYVGSGEGLQRPDLSTGDGIYKSVDGGRSWTHLGLRDGQQIPQIIVDPGNPDRLFVAVLGHPHGPNPERGIFRSLDGGRSFEKVLYQDPDSGGIDVAFDPSRPETVYGVLWESRQAPWENGVFSGPGSGVFKSTDGGETWRRIGRGLPSFAADGLGRIGITVAPSLPSRLFATVEARRSGGLYRSDDAGESWYRVTRDERVTTRASDFAEVKVHPRNPDIVFTGSIVAWKSVDGGKTFSALRGAPGGDDYQRIWINPLDPDIMLLASDQGAIVTVNGGRTWSSWYNQPTAQLFHVTTDNAFPYRVCGGQQESGSACVSSRGPDGRITFRDWRPVGADEYAYVAPDPLDPDIVYGGRVTRFDRRTTQVEDVTPVAVRGDDYRVLRTAPLLFSLADPRALYFASNVIWRTRDGGRSWAQLSPDLTRPGWDVPANVGKYRGSEAARPSRRGVIYTVAPSPLDKDVIWAGTDDGLIHLSADGGRRWQDVTPPPLVPWAKVSLIDAGRFDRRTAYAAINTLRLDDLRPHIYRTHDGGKTWVHITAGIPDGGIINVVREDPRRRGLLFAGSEQAVYFSLDDGENWQSLRLNMPATSIRDLVIKDDDLVVATHGRSFWILDDITPLRQLGPALTGSPLFLFRPQEAIRVRWNTNHDTPLPPEEPGGFNPPEGAILDYYLARPAARMTLEISDQTGRPVRRFSSEDPVPAVADEGNVPAYWIRPPRALARQAGHHRLVWDLRGEAPPVPRFEYPIAAVPANTVKEPRGPWAVPGRYTVKLSADGASATEPLMVKMDPRVTTPPAGIIRQHRLTLTLVELLQRNHEALEAVRKARSDLASRRTAGQAQAAAASDAAAAQPLATLEGSAPERGSGGSGLTALHAQLAALYQQVQQADVAPLPRVEAAAATLGKRLGDLLERWKQVGVDQQRVRGRGP